MRERIKRLTGFEHHWHIEWQFDGAIGNWGRHVENKIQEIDEKGKPVNTLEVILGVATVLPESALPPEGQNMVMIEH